MEDSNSWKNVEHAVAFHKAFLTKNCFGFVDVIIVKNVG